MISKTVINELQIWWKTKANSLDLASETIKEIFIEHYYDGLKKSILVENTLRDIFNNNEITVHQIKEIQLSIKLYQIFHKIKLTYLLVNSA